LVFEIWWGIIRIYMGFPITNGRIPNKSQRSIHVSKGIWKLFSTTLLVEVDVVILKYESCSHFLRSSVRRRKRNPHARSPRLASLGGAKGASARHLLEWSAEIWLLALPEHGLLLQF
jgi:hypothetical protein